MNNREIARRLNSMSPKLIVRVLESIKVGNGANTIVIETPATLKQVNACFALQSLNEKDRIEVVLQLESELALEYV